MAPKKTKTKEAFIIAGFLILAGGFLSLRRHPAEADLNFSKKPVVIDDNGLDFYAEVSASTVGDALAEEKISLNDHDTVTPDKTSPVFPGSRIDIARAVKIKILADGKTIENYSTEKTVGGILAENHIILNQLDKVVPDVNLAPQPDSTIVVTRINVEDVTDTENIPYPTTYKEDQTLGWQETRTDQAGRDGQQEVKYRISYKDGKEVSRVVLEKTVIQEPTPAIVTKGTYMQLGKANKGQGTWYSYMGGMFAASTSLPKGSYAKVTNLASGKSIVVQINDYGPQGKGRIIDLDKVAFAKIAPLGAGIIGVKVEPILN